MKANAQEISWTRTESPRVYRGILTEINGSPFFDVANLLARRQLA